MKATRRPQTAVDASSFRAKVFLDVFQKHLDVGRILATFFVRVSHIGMGIAQVQKRIELVDESSLRVEKHQVQWKLPVFGQSGGKGIPLLATLLSVINQYPGDNKCLVDCLNHGGVGEQTCSQVGATGSTALIVQSPPEHDRQYRPLLFLGH